MSFTNALAKALLDHYFMKTAKSQPSNLWVGLSSTIPAEDGTNFTEPSGGSYGRVSTAGTDWNAATTADPSLLDNANLVDFGIASADWASGADLTHVGIFEASSGGVPTITAALDTPKPVLNGDPVSFPAGDLNFTLD